MPESSTHPIDTAGLRTSPVRLVRAIGGEGEGTVVRRGGEALAAPLGAEPVVLSGDYGGFAAHEWSPSNDPAAFARRFRALLDPV